MAWKPLLNSSTVCIILIGVVSVYISYNCVYYCVYYCDTYITYSIQHSILPDSVLGEPLSRIAEAIMSKAYGVWICIE
jgi:hypothetical protein